MMKQVMRAVCLLLALGISAIAAHAQTSIDPSSVPDANVHMSTPDACSPPYEICFEYTGPTLPGNAVLTVFFPASPFPTGFNPATTSYQCSATGTSAEAAAAQGLSGVGSSLPISCLIVATDPPGEGDLWGMFLFIPGAFTGETFAASVTGGLVSFASTGGLSCISGCAADGSWTVDPTPEPGTFVLYMTGLLLFLIAGFAKKRFGANSLAKVSPVFVQARS